MKLLLRIALVVAAATVASAATYIAINRWKTVAPGPSAVMTTGRNDTLEGVNGLREGEIVVLPQLTSLSGETVNLASHGKERLLCVFIGNRCPGCTRDVDLWRALYQEAPKKAAVFHVINIGDERPEIEKFVSAYNLHQLSVLFDPTHKVGPLLKVGFLPQYILFDRNGRVLHRWDGIRHYDKSAGAEQLAEFFQPH